MKVEEVTQDPSINIALDTIKMGKQALLFVGTRPSAEKVAEDIARKIKTESGELEKLSLDVLEALQKPTQQCERLARCIRKGIAFHHSGLVREQKSLIEDSFRNGKVRIICCTPTLAAGVDLPAFRAIIRDLKRFGDRGMNWIPVLEYLQMAGRAGRPRYDTEGQAIIIASTESEAEAIFEKYVQGEPEEIYSKLAVEPVLRVYVLSMIASQVATSRERLHSFFMRTFWGHQFQDEKKLGQIIDRMVGLLEEWGFVGTSDFRNADEEERISATDIGRRVSELYVDPLTAHQLIEGLKSARQNASLFSFAHLVSFTLEMRPLLRVRAKEQEAVEQAITSKQLLVDEPSIYDEDYEDFLNAAKTALFFEEWSEEKDEDYLLEKYSVRPGEIRAKLETADWLLYSSHELARMLKMQPLLKEISKTRVRLRYGVKEELLALLRLKGIGRVRARKLHNNNIKTIGDVKKADISTLKVILGQKVAIETKKQVEGTIKEDKEQYELEEF
ncbi:MAG: helicase-related protein [Nanoarchaeota archaeon]